MTRIYCSKQCLAVWSFTCLTLPAESSVIEGYLLVCRVIAWEPVPIFRAFLEYGLQVNNMTQLARVRDKVVSEKPGREYELTVPLHGIWGTASINGQNIDE